MAARAGVTQASEQPAPDPGCPGMQIEIWSDVVCPWCYIGKRRLEQALAADQDNAIITDDELRPEHEAWFEALAQRVTDDLATCGYPRCPGDIMATNPGLRKPLAHWRRDFSSWLTQPVPEAILRASIFFDMRPVHGDATLHAGTLLELKDLATLAVLRKNKRLKALLKPFRPKGVLVEIDPASLREIEALLGDFGIELHGTDG